MLIELLSEIDNFLFIQTLTEVVFSALGKGIDTVINIRKNIARNNI
jgi:hypothetical protein